MKKQDDLRYPIGKFQFGKAYNMEETRQHIKTIARFPKDLKKIIKKLHGHDYDTPYRPGGWTVRQVVHHLADSHINGYVRMKLTVTEPTPVIKPYEEAQWAETEDGKHGSIKVSMRLLNALHRRWVSFLNSLSEEDLERGFFHPERQNVVLLPEAIALYAWHCQHHLAHISSLLGHRTEKSEAKATTATEAKRRGRPKTTSSAPSEEAPKMTRAEVLAKARAAKKAEAPQATKAKPAAKAAAKAEAPKMTRAEVLAKARAARAAKKAEAPQATKAKPAAKAAAKTEAPKMTRAEVLAKARAARAAKKAESGQPAAKAAKTEGPKMSRGEILAKARAARAAKKVETAAPAVTVESPKKSQAPKGRKKKAE